jgi:hypothetical protein
LSASTARNVTLSAKSVGVPLRMLPHFAHWVSDIQLQTCSDLCLREFPAMPRFQLAPSQVMDVMAYLKTLDQ